jgi:CBS domain-containing protein
MATVADIMQRNVVSLPPAMRIRDAAALLAARQIGGAPVCDETGHVLGMLSKTDLTEAFARRNARIDAIMTPEVFYVRPGDPLERAIELMAFEGVHRVVVVDERGGIAGIVSAMDVLRQLAGFATTDTRVIAIAPPPSDAAEPV